MRADVIRMSGGEKVMKSPAPYKGILRYENDVLKPEKVNFLGRNL
jgi:hypothetical protein